MYRTIPLSAALLLLTACGSSKPAPAPAPAPTNGDLAPASVANKIIEMDGNGAESCSTPDGSRKWTSWQVEEYPCIFAYNFDAKNRYRVNFNPTAHAYLSYRKTGPNTARIDNYGAENHGTYILTFTTPTSGTATNEGSANGRDYKTRNISFTISQPGEAQ